MEGGSGEQKRMWERSGYWGLPLKKEMLEWYNIKSPEFFPGLH
jgi:hypothetical protein